MDFDYLQAYLGGERSSSECMQADEETLEQCEYAITYHRCQSPSEFLAERNALYGSYDETLREIERCLSQLTMSSTIRSDDTNYLNLTDATLEIVKNQVLTNMGININQFTNMYDLNEYVKDRALNQNLCMDPEEFVQYELYFRIVSMQEQIHQFFEED